jgi:prolyl 4-hydroxylase
MTLVGFEDSLVLLKKLSLDELGGLTRTSFPNVGASTLTFHSDQGVIDNDIAVQKLPNSSRISVSYNADYTRFEVLSERPRIVYFPNFLTDEECDEMMAIGKPFIKEAEVGDGSSDGRLDRSTRSSQVHFLTHTQEDHWVPKNIKRKVHATTKLPYDYMESLQLQKYSAPRGSQHDFYVPHMDSLGGPDRRIATMIFYLSDAEEGGETVFPLVSPAHPGRPGTRMLYL